MSEPSEPEHFEHVLGKQRGAVFILVFDIPRRPRLRVELDEESVVIDVVRATVAEGRHRRANAVPRVVIRRGVHRLVDASSGRHGAAQRAAQTMARPGSLHGCASPREVRPVAPGRMATERRPALVSHALAHFEPKTWNRIRGGSVRLFKERAATVLDIDEFMAAAIYCGRPLGFGAESPTATESAAMLRRLADGKIVTWRTESDGAGETTLLPSLTDLGLGDARRGWSSGQ